MRAARTHLVVVCLVAAACADSDGITPMEQVIKLLKKLKKRVEDEAAVESENYQKYERWCDLEQQQAQSDITNAEGDIEELKADINEAAAGEQRKKFDIEKLVSEVSHKEEDLAKERKHREEDHAEFLEDFNKFQGAIDTLDKALKIVSQKLSKQGLAQVAAFVEQAVRRSAAGRAPADRMQAFFQQVADASPKPQGLLQQPQAPVYESRSGQVKQVIQEMLDDITGQQQKLQAEELDEKHTFDLLEQSMMSELGSLQKSLENAKVALAAHQEKQAQLEVELDDAKTYHEEKTTYLSDVSTSCEEKAREWELRSKSRSEELNAIDEATSVLTNDRAKELQKRETRGQALVQQTSDITGFQALGFFQMDALTQRAVSAMSVDPFGKVKNMIKGLVERLLMEQAQEQEHKAWCDSETAKTKKQQKYHGRNKDKFTSRLEEMTARVQQLQEKIQDTSSDIKAMQEALAEATSIRETEKATAEKALTDYADAQQMIQKALQVLSDFYRKRRASESLLQKQMAASEAAPPATFEGTDPGAAREEAASGILNLLEISLSDFTRMESETQEEEAAAQKQYDQFVAENRQSIALAQTDVKHFNEEQGKLTRDIQSAQKDLSEVTVELNAANEYMEKLTADCDFRGPGFEEKQARREKELKSLQNALAIIAGEAIA